MNKNNPNVNEKDDDLDLSSIINEYEEDSVLRQKIEQMKQQKAEEEAQRKEAMRIDSSRSALVVEESVPSAERKVEPVKSTFLDVDKTQTDAGKTRELNVNGELNRDVDKTLVIMDNQHSFASDKEEEAEEEESILVYGDHEVDEEEITDEDIQEFLGDEEIRKKEKREIDPKKMNKIITYVITGAVALCLIVGIGFGVKYMMGSTNDDNKASEVDTTKDKDKTKDTDKDKDTEKEKPKDNNTDTSTTTPPVQTPTTDNSVKIAEINGMIKANNEQINELNAQITNTKNKMNALGYNEDDYIKASTEQLTYTTLVSTLSEAYAKLQTTCDALTKNPEEGKDAQAECQQAAAKKQELDDANKKLAELNTLVEDYKAKKTEYGKYNSDVQTATNQITDLNNKNTDLQRQLSDLQ